MTTPKSPEQIMEEYESLPVNWCDGCKAGITCTTDEWLRSSMASLLCYMAERMPKEEFGYCDACPGWDNAIDDCRTLLIEEARKIAKDMILNEMQPSEERIRKAATEAAEDQNKMVEEARKITNNE